MASLDFRLAIAGSLVKDIEGDIAAIERGRMAAMRLSTEGLKQRLRSQIVSAGLGQRLANSIRSTVYPQRGASANPAGSVFTRGSGHIVLGHHGTLIRPGPGKAYLAIPTENVPTRRRGGAFGGRGTKANPFEVETRFNQDLKFFRTRSGVVLAYIDAIRSKNKRGWRSLTRGRLRQGRQIERVIMFVLIPQVRLRKRLDFDAEHRAAIEAHIAIEAREIDRELDAR